MTQGIKGGRILFLSSLLLVLGGRPGIRMYHWLVPLHKTGSDKRVEMDRDPASLTVWETERSEAFSFD